MREFWIRIDPELSHDLKVELIKKTKDFCTTYVVDLVDEQLARHFGLKTLVSPKDGDILLLRSIDEASTHKPDKKKCIETSIQASKDEEQIAKAIKASIDYVMVRCEDWKIIPLENLIATAYNKSKLIACVSNVREAKLALEALELGADGVQVELSDPEEIRRIYKACKDVKSRPSEKQETERTPLAEAKITKIKELRSGTRTCIDTCDLMTDGEGMLIGCQSSGLFLVQAEAQENPFVATRPFRVNAGSTAQYLLAKEGKTSYLSELRIGDEVLIVDRNGGTRVTNVCRTKIEWRPLLLVEAEFQNQKFSAIVQNAETMRFVTRAGSICVKDLTKDDVVLVSVQEGGRHFGRLVKDERVIEQ